MTALFVIVNSFPVTQGQDAITLTAPLPFDEATMLCSALNLFSEADEFFELCEV